MQLTVERVSQYGIMSDGVWYNWGKGFHPPAGLTQGDVIDIEKNTSGRIATLSVVSQGSGPATPAKVNVSARQTAVNNAFSNLTLEEKLKLDEDKLLSLYNIASGIEAWITR